MTRYAHGGGERSWLSLGLLSHCAHMAEVHGGMTLTMTDMRSAHKEFVYARGMHLVDD